MSRATAYRLRQRMLARGEDGMGEQRQGHPLLATTHRGDLHLTLGTPSLLSRYETATDEGPLRRLVIDRDQMAAESPFEAGRRRPLGRDHPAHRTVSRAGGV
jgi:hypothetical protein